MRLTFAVALLLSVTASADPDPWRIEPIDAARAARMRGVSWHEGCPVALAQLSVVHVRHWTGTADASGELVVATRAAAAISKVFRRLHALRVPIPSVRPIDDFAGSDDASMAANNTSAFNCRSVSGSKRFSRHAYGEAVDLNPLWNPYVKGTHVEPPEGRAFVDRKPRPGLITAGDPVVKAFASIGWKWGGGWRKTKDFQHFSADGT